MLHLVWNKDDPDLEISLDHIRFATAMVDQCIAETREFHQPPDTIATVMMRHVHSLSWDNDRVQDELITWQIAKDCGNTPIRNGGAKGFKRRSRAWVNVYRWARCGRSKRPNHGPKHSGQRWTWGVSAVIAVLSWALRRFRQMDTVLSSLKLQETPLWGTLPAPRLSSWMSCLFVRTSSDLLHCRRSEQTASLSARVHRVRHPAL